MLLLNPLHATLSWRPEISAPLANHIGQQLVQLPTVKYGKIAAAHFRPNPSFSR
jgi:hypothetical protein